MSKTSLRRRSSGNMEGAILTGDGMVSRRMGWFQLLVMVRQMRESGQCDGARKKAGRGARRGGSLFNSCTLARVDFARRRDEKHGVVEEKGTTGTSQARGHGNGRPGVS